MGRKRNTDRDVESSKDKRKSKDEKKDRGFINRKEEVQLKEVQEDDFDLKESCVAKYDGAQCIVSIVYFGFEFEHLPPPSEHT